MLKLFIKISYCLHNKLSNSLNFFHYKQYPLVLFYIENNERGFPRIKWNYSNSIAVLEFDTFSKGKTITDKQDMIFCLKKYIKSHI